MHHRQAILILAILLSVLAGGCGGGGGGSQGTIVSGWVTEGPGGVPVPGVSVALMRGNGSATATVTDTAGRFSFGAVNPGEISLVASLPSRTTTRWSGQVSSGGRQDLVLYSLPLSSMTVDSNPPVVTWRDVDGSGRKWQLQFTDDVGLGQAEVLAEGSTVIWMADLQGLKSWEGTVTLPDDGWPEGEYRLVLRVTDRAAARVVGGVAGNVTLYERQVRIASSPDPPGGSAPGVAPADFFVTAVSVTPAAYAWLAETQGSPSGQVQVQVAGRVARVAAEAAEVVRAATGFSASDGDGTVGGGPVVRVQQTGAGLIYVGLRWRWSADPVHEAEGFLLRRNGDTAVTVPAAVGHRDSSGKWVEYAWSDNKGGMVSGEKVTYTLAAVRGGRSGPAASAGPVEVLSLLADPRLLSPPDGKIASSLPVLEWAGDGLAHGYIVEVLAGDGDQVVWSGFTTGTRVDLAQAAGGGLGAGTYRWRVVALAALPFFLPQRTQYDSISLSVSSVRSFTFTSGTY